MKQKINGFYGPFFGVVDYEPDKIDEVSITELTVCGKFPVVVLVQESLDQNGNPLETLPIAITLGTYGAELRTLKVINSEQSRWGMTLAIEDIYGEYSYSIFELKIVSTDPVNKPLNPEICDISGNVKHENVAIFATKFIHKFVEAYKGVNKSKKDWIPEITPSRLSPWHKMTAKNFEGNEIWTMQVYDQRGTGVGLGNNLSDEQMQLLQTSLKRNYVEDSATKFRQLANKYKIQKDYHSFCVFVVISFEHWVFREIRTALLSKGKTNEEIDNFFYQVDKKGKKRNISREDALALAIGSKNFKNNPSYIQFIEKVVARRDSIVHGRKENLTENCTEEMVNIVSSLMTFLSSKMFPK
ncbi:hypothetical protein [Saccharospirillum alexandrii]|uniref:hypothetical protein n=1 Tax=Saccharospirillum alexandrii TaxID=2448477 RepID=UPI003734E603